MYVYTMIYVHSMICTSLQTAPRSRAAPIILLYLTRSVMQMYYFWS